MTYIVIVNYGRPDDTIACLESLSCLRDARFRVILVDNRSPDESVARIGNWIDTAKRAAADATWSTMPGDHVTHELRLIASDRNGGFAGGCNIGIRAAMDEQDCRYIWLLNNDTIVEPMALNALIDRFEAGDRVGMCGSTLVYLDSPDVIQACGGRFILHRALGWAIGNMAHRQSPPDVSNVEAEMDYVVGASMLVSRDFVDEVGLMDERYFLYFEELDWAIRGARGGFALAWAKQSVVIHKEGSTIGTSTTGLPSATSTFFMTASYLRLVFAHRKRLLPLALVRVIGKAVKRLGRRETVQAIATLRALIDFGRSPWRYVNRG